MSREEILNVMASFLLPRAKDKYYRDAPNPLLFDRVMEGRDIVSKSQFFALPVEILGQIVQYLPTNGLAALALVNSDCRQLARSHQFKSIHLNYSPSSSRLIRKLYREGFRRTHNLGPGTYLGPAIRRLFVSTDSSWVTHRHNVELIRLEELDEQARKDRLKAATDTYFNAYLDVIEKTLSSGALPHLEILEWEDQFVLPESFFTAFACSSIQHLRLVRVRTNHESEIQLPSHLKRCHWPLRSLHLELCWHFPSRSGSRESVLPLSTSILSLCAPTLETLTWIGDMGSEDACSFASNDHQCHFPRLRRLKLSRIKFSDLSILNSFLGIGTRIRELAIDVEGGEIEKNFFADRGRIETLETLYSCAAKSIESLDFLQANSQLSKLTVDSPLPPSFLDYTSFRPLLPGSFHNLTSLSLVWEGTSISDCALELISTLQRLQQLHLSAGRQFGWRHDWRIDHEAIRLHLSKLRELRRLAFSRDSYCDNPGIDIENYYSGMTLVLRDAGESAIGEDVRASEAEIEDEDATEAERCKAVFDKIHCLRMVKEANQYVHSLPRLSWIYVGKVPMAITKGQSGNWEAFPLIEGLDECGTALRQMCGLPKSGSY